MQNKSDVVFYALSLVGFLTPFLLLLVFKYSLGVASTAGALVIFAIYSYASFWGFSMRNALAAPLYRNQALWLGAVGAYFAIQWLLLALFDPFYPYGGTPQTRFFIDSYNDFGYTMIFAWMNATMPLLRQSDPLLRNPLRWQRVKFLLWPLVLLGAVGTDLGLGAVTAVSQTQYPLIRDIFSTTPYPVVLFGAFGVGLGISRSVDGTLRRQLRWFGLSATLIVATFLLGHFANALGFIPASAGIIVQTLDYIMLLLAGVFMFRSAKDVVPVSQVSIVTIGEQRIELGSVKDSKVTNL